MTKLDIKQYLKRFFLKNGVICDSFDQEKDTIARTAHAEIERLETKLADKSGDMSILLAQLEIFEQRLERRTKYKDELIEKQREIILRLTEEKGRQEKEIAQNMFSYNDIHEQLSEAERVLGSIAKLCHTDCEREGLIYDTANIALQEIKKEENEYQYQQRMGYDMAINEIKPLLQDILKVLDKPNATRNKIDIFLRENPKSTWENTRLKLGLSSNNLIAFHLPRIKLINRIKKIIQ